MAVFFNKCVRAVCAVGQRAEELKCLSVILQRLNVLLQYPATFMGRKAVRYVVK
jgi:hypothetical protein